MTSTTAVPTAATAGAAHPSRAQILVAFAIVYVVWGSTYLAMRVAIETLPPFLMGGLRFVLAGGLLLAWVLWRERPGLPDATTWGWAALSGALLFVGGNGGVVWAERTVPSGVVALLAASLAIWMVLLDWIGPARQRPNALVLGGLALGLVGVGVLVGPSDLVGAGSIDPFGAFLVLGGSLTWAAGSLLARSRRAPSSPLYGSALQMLVGGAMLFVLGALHGDVAQLAAHGVSARSLLAVVYLVTFGSLVGFTAYIWLMRNVAPSRVATYAYVNPVVAVLLGWLIGGETPTPRTWLAALVIVGAVALITAGRARAVPPRRRAAR